MLATRMKQTLAVAATAATLWALPQPHARAAPPMPAVLDQAAADAELVVVVPSMSQLSEKIAGFAAQTGLNEFAPEMDDALGAFKREMGWLEGVDDEGPMLVVVTGLAAAIDAEINNAPEQPEPDALMLVPVADYAGFVAQFGGDPAADATAVTFTNGDDGFVKNLAGYAVMGDSMELVRAYAAGEKGAAITEALGAMVDGYLTAGDALVYIDVAAMAPALQSGIEQGMAEMRRQMDGQAAQMPGNFGAMMDNFFTAYEQLGQTLVAGTDKYLLTLEINDAGVALTHASRLKDGSELAGFFKSTEDQGGGSAGPALLASLPDDTYIVASAMDTDAFDTDKLVDKLTAVFTEGQDGGDGAGMMTAFVESLQMMKQANGFASVFYAPEPAAMMAGGFFTSLTVYDVEDADAFVAGQRDYLEKMQDMKIALPTEQGQPAQEMSFTTQYTEKALVIDGTEVHQFQVNTVLPPEMMQQFGPMAAVMGNAGSGGYIAAKDGKVLVTTVTDPQLITRGLKAVSQTDGVGSGGNIANLRAEALPADAALEMYVSVGGIAETVNPFLLMFSPNGQQLNIPENLPPLAMGGATDGTGVAFRTFVPHEVVSFGIDTYRQFAPQPADGPQREGAPRAPRAY